MMKHWFSFAAGVLALCAALTLFPQRSSRADAAGVTSTADAVAAVTTTAVQLRSGPGTSYLSLGRLPKNTAVSIVSTEGNWYYVTVKLSGQTGYLYFKYVKLSSSVSGTASGSVTAASTTTSYAASFSAFVKAARLNLRSGPGTGYAIVDALKRNTSVTVTGIDGKWYFVTVDATGQTGYVHHSYLSKSKTYDAPSCDPWNGVCYPYSPCYPCYEPAGSSGSYSTVDYGSGTVYYNNSPCPAR